MGKEAADVFQTSMKGEINKRQPPKRLWAWEEHRMPWRDAYGEGNQVTVKELVKKS
jgi:hypothetical protein